MLPPTIAGLEVKIAKCWLVNHGAVFTAHAFPRRLDPTSPDHSCMTWSLSPLGCATILQAIRLLIWPRGGAAVLHDGCAHCAREEISNGSH